MCGVVGFLGGASFSGEQGSEAVLKRMADSIAHRGPDDSGTWYDFDQRIGLAHRRLSIVDLSSAGHQPMHSRSGRYVLVFNGEIYNHLDLRRDLAISRQPHLYGDLAKGTATDWRGHSDTETLLAGIEEWGIEAAIKRVIGMFAIAVWDRQTNTLTLARDRVGEKPLYYGWQGDAFLFGSELKALRRHPAFKNEVDRDSLCLFLRYNYVPTPYSIYRGIAKLQPGSILRISMRKRDPEIRSYWSLQRIAEEGLANPSAGTELQLVDELEALLTDVVRRQMIADVPLGAFLSGGVDSSTLVALMQAQSSQPIRTFTIGFLEQGYSEAVHAKAVARHLGTQHTELYVTPQDAMAVIPRLPTLYDEPFADSSQIPTLLVAQLARQHVTVSLSGDGGDELFCGYNRYQLTSKYWNFLASMPKQARKLIAEGITAISPDTWNRYGSFLPLTSPGDKLHKAAGILASSSLFELYSGLVSSWADTHNLVVGGAEPTNLLEGSLNAITRLDSIEKMMALDLLTYLPDDILAKVDRATMGVSMESRMPYLDHRVIEFAWRVPFHYKLRRNATKWILRQVLYRHVPQQLIERPKMGFGLPIDKWLRGPLRDWADNLIDPRRLSSEGYFNPAPIRKRWDEHLSGAANYSGQLWGVLMFQLWNESIDSPR